MANNWWLVRNVHWFPFECKVQFTYSTVSKLKTILWFIGSMVNCKVKKCHIFSHAAK